MNAELLMRLADRYAYEYGASASEEPRRDLKNAIDALVAERDKLAAGSYVVFRRDGTVVMGLPDMNAVRDAAATHPQPAAPADPEPAEPDFDLVEVSPDGEAWRYRPDSVYGERTFSFPENWVASDAPRALPAAPGARRFKSMPAAIAWWRETHPEPAEHAEPAKLEPGVPSRQPTDEPRCACDMRVEINSVGDARIRVMPDDGSTAEVTNIKNDGLGRVSFMVDIEPLSGDVNRKETAAKSCVIPTPVPLGMRPWSRSSHQTSSDPAKPPAATAEPEYDQVDVSTNGAAWRYERGHEFGDFTDSFPHGEWRPRPTSAPRSVLPDNCVRFSSMPAALAWWRETHPEPAKPSPLAGKVAEMRKEVVDLEQAAGLGWPPQRSIITSILAIARVVEELAKEDKR